MQCLPEGWWVLPTGIPADVAGLQVEMWTCSAGTQLSLVVPFSEKVLLPALCLPPPLNGGLPPGKAGVSTSPGRTLCPEGRCLAEQQKPGRVTPGQGGCEEGSTLLSGHGLWLRDPGLVSVLCHPFFVCHKRGVSLLPAVFLPGTWTFLSALCFLEGGDRLPGVPSG